MIKWVNNFIHSALTRRELLPEAELRSQLARVSDNDPCLLALRELLARHLLQNAAAAGSIHSDDTTKLRSCERLEFARMFLAEFEELRQSARADQARQQKP